MSPSRRPLTSMLLGPLLAACVVACGDSATAPASGTALAIQFSDSAPFEGDLVVASVRGGGDTVAVPLPVTWLVDDTVRATIDAQGRLTLRAPGTVVVSARVGARSASRPLTARRLAVQGVQVGTGIVRLNQGDVVTVPVRLEGTGGRNIVGRPVTLSIADPAVAVVDPSGRVRAVGPGATTLRAVAEGVMATVPVEVAAASAALTLSRVGEGRLPLRVSADTVEWNGAREYHEVWVEGGRLRLTGGTRPGYELDIRYVQYEVRTVDGRRELRPRMTTWEFDRGVVRYDARGDLLMTSELFSPLSHTAVPSAQGVSVRYRIPGTDERLELFYRREP